MILKKLAEEREDIVRDSQEGWKCLVPGYSDKEFVQWFCGIANAVVQVGATAGQGSGNSPTTTTTTTTSTAHKRQVNGVGVHEISDADDGKDDDDGTNEPECDGNKDSPPPTHPTWLDNRNTILHGFSQSRIRPDFILTYPNHPVAWSSVLLIGEHTSGKTPTPESLRTKLAQYAEQVFIAQPFRCAVTGIQTSNTGPKCEFWRFDRGGAVGSREIVYSKGEGLRLLVRTLVAACRMPPRVMGFHTESISWNPAHPQTSGESYPLGNMTNLTTYLPTGEPIQVLSQIFVSPGIVSRGTRVWKGLLRSTNTVPHPSTPTFVAIKYAWRSTNRISEAAMYLLATSRGVRGLPPILSYSDHEDIFQDVRFGLSTPLAHNRHYTRLVLGVLGRPVSDPSLTPLEVARALLAAVVIHADLFFTGGILHRDLSPNNIISLQEPQLVCKSTRGLESESESDRCVFMTDTMLYGCLIDLDYAIDISPDRGQSTTPPVQERTGTYPFIAIQILTASEPHRYRHDLESLLYVLLWLCIYPCSPTPAEPAEGSLTSKPTKSKWHHTDPLKPWFSLDPDTVAAHKVANIIVGKAAFEELLGRFKTGVGWRGFKRVARKWRLMLWEVLRGTG